jgi:hypothetical protein
MKGNDLSAEPTRRYWVMAEVVFLREETTDTKKTGWFSTKTTSRVTMVPDLRVLSLLWRWSGSLGVRLEIIFAGDLAVDATSMWETLERSAANPFSDWNVAENLTWILNTLPYRPDLMGIIDVPERSAMYGGRGLTIANIQ